MDKEGNVIVTSLDTLKSLPNVIGVAAGENKREAVKGTLTLGVCGALAQMIKKMHDFVHFLPCRLPKEPKNRGFLRSKAAKTHKSHRLLGYMDILITNEDTARWLINNRTPFAVGESEISGRERSHKGEIYAG